MHITFTLSRRSTVMVIMTFFVLQGGLLKDVFALNNGLALTPPMGWNHWFCLGANFGGEVAERAIRSIADSMASKGFKDAGYTYVVIDDCWQGTRDASGNIQASTTRFPSGMPALTTYLHGKGFKAGIYTDVGTKTCGGYIGSKNYEVKDAQQYANWGFDFVKYDYCNDYGDPVGTYTKMRNAIRSTGRPMVYSICEWGKNQPWLWGDTVGHMWRMYTDNCWGDKCATTASWDSCMVVVDRNANLARYAGPGHWNDPDFLMVGNGMSDAEDRSHFSMWCIMASPLIMSTDVRKITPTKKAILLNTDLIAINQDSLGKQGTRVKGAGQLEVWVKQLRNNSYAVALLNRTRASATIAFNWTDIGLQSASQYLVRDLWTHQDLGTKTTIYSSVVPSHDVAVFKLSPASGTSIYNTFASGPQNRMRIMVNNQAHSVQVIYGGEDRYSISIINSEGQTVAMQSGVGASVHSFDMRRLNSGCFVVVLKSPQSTITSRAVIAE